MTGSFLNSFSWPEGRRAGIARSKITQDVRQYAKEHGITEQEALKEGMHEQAVKFVKGGSEIYKEL